MTGVTPGQDVPLSLDKVQANRNFANKLWNTARFIVLGLDGLSDAELTKLAVTGPMGADELADMPLPERHIISRCHGLVTDVTAQLESYDFGPAGQSIYAFLWDEYADWYIEISKRRIGSTDAAAAAKARRTLVYVLDSCLRLLHPFMPFVTEELWQRLPHAGESLMISRWPQMEEDGPLATDARAVAHFESAQALVRSVRNARAEYKVEPAKKIGATVVAPAELAAEIEAEADALAFLARVAPDSFRVTSGAAEAEEAAVQLVVEDGLMAYLPLAEMVDAKKERARLGKQRTKLSADLEKLEKRLSSPGFAEKAPPHILQKTQGEVAELNEKLTAVAAALEQLPPE